VVQIKKQVTIFHFGLQNADFRFVAAIKGCKLQSKI